MSEQWRIVFPIEALDGGLNNKYEPNIVDDSESTDCKNVVFDDRGGVQTRLGCSKFNTTSVGSFSGDGLFVHNFSSGTEAMVGWWNGTAYRLTGNTTFTTIGSGQSVYTADTRVDSAMYQDLAFYGNGYVLPYKYNATEFTRHGIYPPNSGPATANVTSGTAAASTVTGPDVQYKITYVNSYAVESDVNTATGTFTLSTTAPVSLQCLPVAPTSYGVSARRIYRSDNGAAYKLVTEIADNTTTTYEDSKTNANLTSTAPTDQGVPPKWKFIVSHQERLWMISPDDPSYLYYSELGNPFVVKATNFIFIGDGDGETITSLSVHANMICVGKTASVWLIYMPDTDPTNWIRVKSKSKYGVASHYAQSDFKGLKMFIGRRYGQIAGFYALAGEDTQSNTTDLNATSVTSDSESDRIEPDVFSFNSTHISKSCAIEFKNKLWFSVPYTTSTVPNRVYQFDFQRRDKSGSHGSWVPFTYPHGFSAFVMYSGSLYAQSSTAHGFVYKLETNGFSDDGTAIDSYIWTKEFAGKPQHLENWKDFRWATFIVETLGAYNMNITRKVDGDSGSGTSDQVSLSAGANSWGNFTWGATTWGGGQTRKRITLSLGVLSGKRIQFKFDNQNTVNQGFHVLPQGSFSYNLRGIR